jgi:uncharacterized membrane protein YhhN
LRIGLFFFLLGQLLYIISLLFYIETIHTLPLVLCIAAALPMCPGVYRLAQPRKGMRRSVIAYSIVIETMGVLALQLMLNQRGPYGIMVFAGSLLFMLSDAILGYFTFHALPRRGKFYVMLPYILAQAAIITGFAPLGS